MKNRQLQHAALMGYKTNYRLSFEKLILTLVPVPKQREKLLQRVHPLHGWYMNEFSRQRYFKPLFVIYRFVLRPLSNL